MPGQLPVPLDVVVPAALDGQRVDRVLSMLAAVPRGRAAQAVDDGAVRLDGQVVMHRSRPLRGGQRLQAVLAAPAQPSPSPSSDVAFGVVHEDAQIVVVDKPAGLVVHMGAGPHRATLVDGLLARFPDLAELTTAGVGEPTRPGIVHRLDKGTSGLLVVARTPQAFVALSAQFKAHRAERRYLALVAGQLESERGEIDAPIGRSARHPKRMAVRDSGRPARTAYEVMARYGDGAPATLVDVRLETGRTHQVRVHFAAIGHAVVGDDTYGPASPGGVVPSGLLVRGRLFLHAWRLTIEHPDGGPVSWESPLPADLAGVLDALREADAQAG